MSIERYGNKYELQCDFCSNSIDDFLDFQEAVDYKKANNWKSSKINGEWFDKCPHCLKKKEEFTDYLILRDECFIDE